MQPPVEPGASALPPGQNPSLPPEDFAQVYACVLETLTGAVLVTDAAGSILYANAAANQIFGYDRGELTGCPVTLLEADTPSGGERRYRRKNGTVFSSAVRIQDIEIQEKRFRVYIQDPAGSEDVELYRSAPVGLLFIDSGLRMVRANQRFTQLFGLNGDLQGRPLREVVPSLAAVDPVLLQVLETRQPAREKEIRAGERWFSLHCGPAGEGVSVVLEDITERKASEDAIRASASQLLMVIDGLPGLVSYLDRDLRYRFTNRGYAEWFGRSITAFRGKTAREALGEQIYPISLPYLERALRGETVEYEATHQFRPEHAPRDVRIHYKPDQAADGSVRGIVVMVEDITERRRAQEALRHSEQRYRALVEASSQQVWTAGETGQIRAANAGLWTQLTGQPEQEQAGWGWLHMVHPDDRERVRREWQDAAAGSALDTEYRIQSRAGDYRYFTVRAVALRDDAGRFREFVGTFADVTARKEAEETLRSSEERFRRIVQTAAEGIWTVDTEGRTTFVNERMAGLLGCSVDELAGRWAFDFVFEEDRPRALELFAVSKTGSLNPYDFRLRRRDGAPLWISVSAGPLRDSSGNLLGVLAMITDNSARKQAEEARDEIQRQLTLLVEASASLLTSPDPAGVLRTILDMAQRFVTADAYAIWRNTGPDNIWRIAAQVGLSDSYHPEATDSAESVRRYMRAPMLIEDVGSAPFGRSRTDLHRAEGIQALVTVPLRIHGEATGTLVFYYRSPHRFTELETRLTSALGNLAASALSAAEFYERENRLRQRAEAEETRARFLAEAGRVLSSSLDYEATLRKVAELAVPSFADWVSVDLLEPDGQVRRVAVQHTDPAKVQLAYDFNRRWPTREGEGAMRALQSHRSVLVEEIPDEALAAHARDPEHLEAMRALGVKSVILAPLLASGRSFGVITFTTAESNRRYSHADLALAEELASRAATAMENARLFRESSTAQEALRRSNTELLHLNDDLNQFAYSASHDLQEPLRMVVVFSQMLARKYGDMLDREAQDYIRYTVQGGKRMELLLRDLLTYTRTVTSPAGELETIDPKPILEEALSNLKTAIDESGAEVTIRPLPPVRVEPLHLLQLFQNIIGNAIKYRAAQQPRIEVGWKEGAQPPTIYVADNGIGIAPEYREKIFGIFKRLHTAEEYPGTGIGLAICQKIIERYGGRIWAESEPGRGTTFYFTLPGLTADLGSVAHR